MQRLRLLPIGLLSLLATVVATGDDPQPSDDVLNNKNGLSPCNMKDLFQTKCENPQARDDAPTNSSRPVFSTPCTCSNIYFNLWSACIWTENSSLPLCESLEQQCAQASINITIEEPPHAESNYPGWAYTVLPSSNGTFNLIAAIEAASASPSHKWTAVQIIIPIIVGLSVAAAFLVFFLVFRRRRKISNRQQLRRPWMETIGNRPRFQFPTMSSAHKVRELNRSNSWSIDEREEDLEEYQFVSYPASLQGSHVSGHVRLSSSSSPTHPPGRPVLNIPASQPSAVRALPGKSIWKGPLESARQLRDAMPRPWRTVKRVPVKSVPSYTKFRVDASDSDSPLSQHPHHESLLGRTGRSASNLHNETLFEREEDEDESDSDTEGLPLIPQEHSRSNHDAEPPPQPVIPTANALESPGDVNGSQRPDRQIPPFSSAPSMPLPPPPPPLQQPAVRAQTHPAHQPPPISPPAPQQQPVVARRSQPTFPPAPTSPPPPPPAIPRRSPRTPRTPLPPPHSSSMPLPSPSLSSPAVSLGSFPLPPTSNPIPPLPRHRPSSDGGSSVRSLPFTPSPPYARGGPPAPILVLEAPRTNDETPPNTAPPYVQRPSLDYSHSPVVAVNSPNETTRFVRRLPLPPGQ
ncbi:hypothetical protein C8R44DRAFT_776802 [Mycena epipterygia]|nr:hypothetical protein C8R44DRAFT_776802 [Mycena epipterygia]